MKWNKKAKSDIIIETTIFIILNIVFIAVLLLFVMQSSRGAVISEQIYAKQIALMIDEAKPETIILYDIEEILKIAEKNNIDPKEAVIVNEDENKVVVTLRQGRGYSYNYFSDYDVEFEIDGIYLKLKIMEKEINEIQG